MSTPVQASDNLRNPAREAAVLEWAASRLAVGTPSSVDVAGSLHTVKADNSNVTVILISPGLVTVRLPAGDSIPVGHNSLYFAAGAGGVKFDITSVSVRGASPKLTIAQNESVYIEKVGVNTWIVVGGTAA